MKVKEKYKVKEVAKILGVTPGRVRQLITVGRIKAVKEGSPIWEITDVALAEYRKLKIGRPRKKGRKKK